MGIIEDIILIVDGDDSDISPYLSTIINPNYSSGKGSFLIKYRLGPPTQLCGENIFSDVEAGLGTAVDEVIANELDLVI